MKVVDDLCTNTFKDTTNPPRSNLEQWLNKVNAAKTQCIEEFESLNYKHPCVVSRCCQVLTPANRMAENKKNLGQSMRPARGRFDAMMTVMVADTVTSNF